MTGMRFLSCWPPIPRGSRGGRSRLAPIMTNVSPVPDEDVLLGSDSTRRQLDHSSCLRQHGN